MKIYRYIFCNLYNWSLKKWGKTDDPKWNAVLGVCFVMGCNLLFLALLFELIGIDVFLDRDIDVTILISISSIILGYNSYRYVFRKKHISIVNDYNDDTIENKRKYAILSWIFGILSFIIPIVLILIIRKIRN